MARLKKMGLDEPGMGWHAFRRFRNPWPRGKRCQEDINNFWMGHKPKTTSELYSHLLEELTCDWSRPKPLDLVSISPRGRLLHRLHRDLKLKFFKKWL